MSVEMLHQNWVEDYPNSRDEDCRSMLKLRTKNQEMAFEVSYLRST